MYLDHITDDELADVGALLENGVRLGLEVMRLVQKYRTDKTGGEELLEVMEAYRKETPFFFKGDITDLSYFWQGKALDLKSLEKLPEELKESVVRNFELLEKQGYLYNSQDVCSFCSYSFPPLINKVDKSCYNKAVYKIGKHTSNNRNKHISLY